ncbi:MAG: CvpA family protein [Hyphomicrobiales bacterium]|nr:CvpA family protein [Hyphomicrobiales bacterium]
MPSYIDLGIIGVILLSALLAMLRGFTREILAIASWGLAAVAALYLHPLVLPYVKPYIAKDTIALAVAAAAVFFVALILVSIVTVRFSDMILDSKVGALDRSLGFVFGAARGLLLCAVAFIFFNWLMPDKSQPEWVKNAKMKPLLSVTGDQIMAFLPDDPESILAKFKKKTGLPSEDAPAETDQETKPAAPAPAAKPAPAKRTDAGPPNPTAADRKGLDALVTGATRR